jgi:hypothetical protein
VAKHEAEQRQAGKVDPIRGTAKRVVVAEPDRQLAGIPRTADRGEQRHVVGSLPVGRRCTDPLAEARGDEARAQKVLGGLREREVDPERERGDQLGKSKLRVVRALHLAQP